MASPAEPLTAARTRARLNLEGWNRRLHYYLGLFFLFFIWLFSLTGLLLNHPDWARHAADRRSESRDERTVEITEGLAPVDQARRIMAQLGLTGEIDWPASTPAGRFDFSVSRPVDSSQVRVDVATGRASIQHFENTRFAAFRIFHAFNGSRYTAAPSRRDWAWTTAWTVLMDAFAAALIVMVLGSYYMWYRLKRTHRLGFVVLAGGLVTCLMFVAGF